MVLDIGMARDRVFLVLEAGSTLVCGMSHELGTYTLLAKIVVGVLRSSLCCLIYIHSCQNVTVLEEK